MTTAVRQLYEEVKQERSIGNDFLDPLKIALIDLLSGLLNVSTAPLISSNISDRVRRLLDFLQVENEEEFSGIIFVRERVKACCYPNTPTLEGDFAVLHSRENRMEERCLLLLGEE